MKAILIGFGVLCLLAGLSDGLIPLIIVGIVSLLIGLSMKSANEKEKEREQKKASVPTPRIPQRSEPVRDINLKNTSSSEEILNRFKNNDFCKMLLKELTEEDLYKSIEVYEDKITIGNKQYIYEDYGLRELEFKDVSTLANYLGIYLTNNSSYLIERIKNKKDKIIGYRVYQK